MGRVGILRVFLQISVIKSEAYILVTELSDPAMRNLMKDDHIYFGTLGLICVFSLMLIQSVSGHTSASLSPSQTDTATPSRQTQVLPSAPSLQPNRPKIRTSVRHVPDSLYQEVARHIVQNGQSCPFLVNIEPLVLSGMYQVHCQMDRKGTKSRNYFYNGKSGFMSLMR